MELKTFKPLWIRVLSAVAIGLALLPDATANSPERRIPDPFLAVCPCENAPEREFSKTINREFSTTADGTTALYNKYGKVNVNTWQNNSVKIDITIVVNADNQEAADRVLKRINVNFTNTAGYVKAETMIDPENSGSWGGIWNWGNNSCQDFKINYEVFMPIGNQLDLKNKYGDSYVSNLNGKLTAEIKYGDLRTETIGNDCDLYLGYGKATFAQVNNLSGQVSYGELYLTNSKDISLDTKYSDLKLDRAGNVRLISKYDDIVLGSIADLRLQTKYSDVAANQARAAFLTAQYTDVRIANLSESVDADMTYGGLKVEALNRGFQDVNLTGKYTDFVIMVERGAAFRFEAEGSYTDLKYPGGATIRRKDEHGSWESIKGFVGEENAKGQVKAKLSYGDFVLK